MDVHTKIQDITEIHTSSSELRIKTCALFELARPRHAVKNLIVLLPWALTGFNESAIESLGVLFVFCFASIAVYAINDALDSFYDMHHPTKYQRPVASGRLSESEAFIFAAACIAMAILIGILFTPLSIFFALAYLVINIFYSAVGKDIAIIDVLLVSSGFVLRFLAGSSVIAVQAEINWVVGPIFLVAAGFALGKRFAKQISSSNTSATLRIPKLYTADNLSGMLISLSHLSVLFGAWLVFTANSTLSNVASLSSTASYMVAIIAVLVLSRIVFLMMRKAIEPAAAFTRDGITMVGCLLLTAIVVGDQLT